MQTPVRDARAYVVHEHHGTLAQVVELTKKVKKPETQASYPASVNSSALRALYDNLENNEQLALAIDGEIRSVKKDGWRGIMSHHTPFMTSLVNGTLMYRLLDDPVPHYVALYGGTLEVKSNQVVILTAAAESGDDVQELALHLLERQADADALAFEAHIEFTKDYDVPQAFVLRDSLFDFIPGLGM